MNQLLSELKRRKVFRVAAAYAVIGWLIMQLSTHLEGALNLPAWFDTLITLVVILGFPIALILAWAFEMTPQGLRIDSINTNSEGKVKAIRWKIPLLLVSLVSVICLAMVWLVFSSTFKLSNQTNSSDPLVTQRSIAVLPFEALSDDASDVYLGKGIAEELLNALAHFPDLKVAARTSAFSFESKAVDLREIGKKLSVAHVLEGSVRRSGKRLRITAKLIRVSDGFQMWSESYQRQFTDIFEIQDEIVANLSRVLQFRLGVGAGVGRAADFDVNPLAYEEYMRGLDLWYRRTTNENRTEAVKVLKQVTELDPDFADGWAAYATSLALSGSVGVNEMQLDKLTDETERAFNRALLLDSDNIRAHTGLVYWHTSGNIDLEESKRYLDETLKLAPNQSFSHYSAATYHHVVGNVDQAIEEYNRALSLDPLNEIVNQNRFSALSGLGKYEQGKEAFSALIQPCQDTDIICQFNNAQLEYSYLLNGLTSASTVELQNWRNVFHEVLIAGKFKQLVPANSSIRRALEFWLAYTDQVLAKELDIDSARTSYATDYNWAEADLSGVFFDYEYTSVASVLAQNGQLDKALNFLFSRFEKYGFQGAGPRDWYPFLPGRLEMPDSLRSHPRYHEFWLQNGLVEIARVRRETGMTAGLPLPITQ